MLDFGDFSERSFRVIDLAEEESRRLGHNFIGSEQLLVGLLSVESGAAQLLNAASVNLEATQAEVEELIGRGSGYVADKPPFTPRASRSIEAASAIAREHESNFVEPEHLLLSILKFGESLALKILQNLGVSISQLREETLAKISTLPKRPVPQLTQDLEAQVNSLPPVIPPVRRSAPRSLTAITLPQETGRWVAEVSASGSLDGPSFKSIGYGDNEFHAIASALESLARTYRNYRA